MKNPSAPGIWVRIGTFFLSLILFASVVCAIFICDVRIITDKDNMSAVIRQALFTAQTTRRSPAAGGSGTAMSHIQPRLAAVKYDSASSSDATEALVEWVYNTLEQQYGEEMNLSLENVQAFVEESTLKDEIADLGASLISDFYTGENTTKLDAETISGLLEENASLIEQHFGYTMTEMSIDAITDTIVSSDYIAKIQKDGIANALLGSTGAEMDEYDDPSEGNRPGPDAQNPGSALADLLTYFRSITSTTALASCAAAAVVCMVLILILNRKWLNRALRCMGVPMLLAAIPYLIPTLAALLLTELWNILFSFSSGIGAAVRTIMELTAPVCIGTFAAGLILCIAALVVRIAGHNKKDMTQALSEALTEEPVTK